MHIVWEEKTVRWFLDASDYTGFHRALAQKIIPYLEPGGTLCDAGCGLGRLSLELAPYVSAITAVDLSENAVAVFRRDAEARKLHNLNVSVQDAGTLADTFDVILMSFFGQSNIMDFLKICRRKLIRIVSADNKSGLYPARHRCYVKDTVPIVQEELAAQGISYKLELHSIEFGQPLRSRLDAEQYVLQNAPEADADEVSGFLDENIVYTQNDEFPLYLPNQKELGIFVIDKEG